MPEKPADPPAENIARPRPRIEGLSDLIFGLALSVGSLALVSHLPTSSTGLYQDIGSFGFTFLILISVWFAYTRIMSVMPTDEPRTVTLNTILLFTVSIEPFLFILLNASGETDGFYATVSQIYALDLGVMMAVLASFAGSLATDPKVRIRPVDRADFLEESVGRFVVAGVFFVSALPIFAEIEVYPGVSLRVAMWFVPFVFIAVRRRTSRRHPRHARET